jgi:hypothetical protein
MQRQLIRPRQNKRDSVLQRARNVLHVLFFGIAIVIAGAKVLSAARFISTAFGGRIALVCAQFCIARFISIVAAGR